MKKKSAAAARADPPVDQPRAVPERGEHELDLGGVVYRLRPSRTAIRAIEAKTERSLMALVRMGNAGDLTTDQLGTVSAELIRAGAEDDLTRNVGAERLSDMIYEEGVAPVCARLTLCLLDALSGGRTAEGNAKAATA